MKSTAISPGSWSTASFGGSPDTSPVELSSLGEHLGLCKNPRHLFALHCAAETVRGFMLTRFVTTSAVIVLLIGLATMVV